MMPLYKMTIKIGNFYLHCNQMSCSFGCIESHSIPIYNGTFAYVWALTKWTHDIHSSAADFLIQMLRHAFA